MKGNSQPDWRPHRQIGVGLVTLLALFLGFGLWSGTAELSGAIIAPGRIEVDSNRQVVQHPQGGVIRDIRVQEGARVKAGDVLLELDGAQTDNALALLETQLFELLARQARLQAESSGSDRLELDAELSARARQDARTRDLIEGQQLLFATRRASRAQAKASLARQDRHAKEQIAGLAARKTLLSRQLDLIAIELRNQETLLQRGLIQTSRVLALRRSSVEIETRISEAEAAIGETRNRIASLSHDVQSRENALKEDAITRLRDVRTNVRHLKTQRRQLLHDRSRLALRAPVDGIVYGMSVFARGAVVRPADPLLYIVPQDRPLVVSVRISAPNIDEVGIGQDVDLRLAAFDDTTTPRLQGRVVQVSPDAFTDDGNAQSFYRARITFNPGEVARLTPHQTLIPGMPVEAFLRTSSRTPLEYFAAPLARYFSRALREG